MPANGAGPIAPSPETVAERHLSPAVAPGLHLPEGQGARPRRRSRDSSTSTSTRVRRWCAKSATFRCTTKEQEMVRARFAVAQDRHDVHRDGQPQPGDPGTASQPIDHGADVATRAGGPPSSSSSGRCFSAPRGRSWSPLGIILVLLWETAAFLREVPLTSFLFGTVWTPLFFDKQFGVLPLVSGTLLASAIAMLVALPAGLLIADLSQRVRATPGAPVRSADPRNPGRRSDGRLRLLRAAVRDARCCRSWCRALPASTRSVRASSWAS